MSGKSLTEKMADKKKAEAAKDESSSVLLGGVVTGMANSVEENASAEKADTTVSTVLGNDGLVTNGDPSSVMAQAANQLQEGLAQNADMDKQNEIALKILEGEEKRQRMLEGRPRDTDIAEESADMEAPEGGYKSLGMVRFVDNKGNWVKAVNGYFVPKTEEEKKILDHFVTTYQVEAPKEQKED